MASLDTLLSLAEVAVTLAGFSAIVVVFKRGEGGKWERSAADYFKGMIVHAAFAVLFCLLPSLLNVAIQDSVTTTHVAAAILGVQICAHSVGVMFAKTTPAAGRVSLSLGVVIGLTQFAAFTDWGVHREFDIYVIGIMWHILQAGVLFVMLIWIAEEDIE